MQQSQSSEPSQAIVQSDSGNRKGANNAFKRPRVVGHGVFVSKDGFICAEVKTRVNKLIFLIKLLKNNLTTLYYFTARKIY